MSVDLQSHMVWIFSGTAHFFTATYTRNYKPHRLKEFCSVEGQPIHSKPTTEKYLTSQVYDLYTVKPDEYLKQLYLAVILAIITHAANYNDASSVLASVITPRGQCYNLFFYVIDECLFLLSFKLW